jgi:hypothetical protein
VACLLKNTSTAANPTKLLQAHERSVKHSACLILESAAEPAHHPLHKQLLLLLLLQQQHGMLLLLQPQVAERP